MSSYLTIYIVPKRKSEKEEKKYIPLTSYSRNSEIYQYFYENIHPAYIGNEEPVSYTVLTSENIATVLTDFVDSISKTQTRLTEYEKYASGNPEYIDEIIELKEYIKNLQYWKDKTSFVYDIINDINIFSEIEEVCCNID